MRHAALALPVLLALFTGPGLAAETEPPELLGRVTVDDLRLPPFDGWFAAAHDGYEPNAELLARLRPALAGVEVELFFGTWCGDSRREVPRWTRTLAAGGLPASRLRLIAVDDDDGSLKRSPDGEEQGREIWRVPTLIVRRDGRELGRVVEFPQLSIERDLVAILDGAGYAASYRSYPTVRRWLDEGLLGDPNVGADGLATQLLALVDGEGELAAAARVLQDRGQLAEGLKLAQANCALHRDSASCRERLAEAALAAGEPALARRAAERALRLDGDPQRVEALLELLERATR